MWLAFGILAVIFAILNLVFAFRGKEAKYFRFMSMALTILTLWVALKEELNLFFIKDFTALEDTAPTLINGLFVCAAGSIIINSVSLFKEKK